MNRLSSIIFPSIYDEPSKHKVKIEKERKFEKNIMERDAYRDYIKKPLSKSSSKGAQHVRVFWESASREMMSSACLLPTIPPKDALADCQIIRTEFIAKDTNISHPDTSIWYFYGQYNYITQTWSNKKQEYRKSNPFRKKALIKEIDLTSCFFDRTNAALLKELYLLHFFEHENLQHALATDSEPNLFRMSIILPLSISLEILGQGFDLKRIWQGRPFYPYIPICILRALKYLHERDIVHKSVKAENCFFDLDGNILLGAFNNVQISNVEEEKSTDIWDLGTTILDHIFQTEQDGFQAQFPDSTSVTQYHSLIQMLDDIGRNNRDPNDNPLPNNDARILTLTAQNHFTHYIPNDSPLCAFLDIILRASNRPTAVFLLEHYGYTNVNENEFGQLKLEFTNFVKRSKFETPKLLPFQNVSDPQNADLQSSKQVEIPCDHYQRSLQNPRKKFRNGSVINVAFTLISDLHNPSRIPGSFVVGEEETMFKLLMWLLQLVSQPKNLQQKNGEKWDFVNISSQLFEEWDVFRLRAALHTMLIEAANRFDEKNEEILTVKNSEFILCNHREKLKRRVQIQIKFNHEDIINIDEKTN